MISLIDTFLNRITMYRLVLYYLIALWAAAVVGSIVHLLPYDPVALISSLVVITAVSWMGNELFAWGFDVIPNIESVYITALILALIMNPVAYDDYAGMGMLAFVSAWAMASKYLFAIGKKHIFNPAALGAALGGFVLGAPATWWAAGNPILLPIVIIGGLLVVRKIHRFDLVLSFVAVALGASIATAGSGDAGTVLSHLLHSSLFFLAFIMLTEPLATPPTRLLRIAYGAFTGLLFTPAVHVGSLYSTPELALLIGNVFAYVVSPKGRYMLRLVERKEIAAGVHEFAFESDRQFAFKPGQYLEWTLGNVPFDSRGNRRYFTIASSPTERFVRLGVKFYDQPSGFKRTLEAMAPGDLITASQLSGDFTLPRDAKRKLVFIAGGIGATPFRSMIQNLLDTKDVRDVTMLYSNKTIREIAYADIFERAVRELGMKVVYAVTDERVQEGPSAHSGPIDRQLIERAIPDFRERTFYISGPQGMVDAFKGVLGEMGVPRRAIKTDYFPGF